MPSKLTDRLVRSLPSPASGNKITYCDELKGFGCRVTHKGAKAFVLNYTVNRRERRITIGSYPEWSVQAAREQATKLKREIDLGGDPLGKREADRDAPTVQDLFDRYAEEHLPRKAARSAADDASMWRTYILPNLGKLKLRDLTPSEVDALHRKISRLHKTRANRVVEVLRKGLSLANRWGWVDQNAASGVQRNPEQPRHRYLSDREIAYVSLAMDHCTEQLSADAIRLLMLTGARKGEVLAAEWSQFDLHAGVWTKPSHHTKQRREHRVPLSAPAQQLLSRLSAEAKSETYVFPGRMGTGHLQDVKRTWQAIKEDATVLIWKDSPAVRPLFDALTPELERGPKFSEIVDLAKARNISLPTGVLEVRIHDLRHTYASILAGRGTSLALIGALLGHTQTQTTARYAHLADDPLRKATQLVADALGSTTSPGEVIPLRRA